MLAGTSANAAEVPESLSNIAFSSSCCLLWAMQSAQAPVGKEQSKVSPIHDPIAIEIRGAIVCAPGCGEEACISRVHMAIIIDVTAA